jgi:adenylate kinase family enzyme
VPLLGSTDRLPYRPQHVLVAGASGSGKTRLAALVGQRWELSHVEIDGLFHGPGWTPRESFEADVERFSAAPRWVIEWQYSAVRQLLADRADLVIWLDLPRSVVMRQVIARTVRRRRRREVLWNGNVEPPFRTIFTDREHIVRWAWTSHHTIAPRIADLLERRPDLPVVRLGSRKAVETWLAAPDVPIRPDP